MKMPIAEVVDRYTILKLKLKYLPNSKNLPEQYNLYKKEVNRSLSLLRENKRKRVKNLIQKLSRINKIMWDLEYGLQLIYGRNDLLAEAGKIAIKIRIYNGKRIRLKNEISQLFHQDVFREVKVHHISESNYNGREGKIPFA